MFLIATDYVKLTGDHFGLEQWAGKIPFHSYRMTSVSFTSNSGPRYTALSFSPVILQILLLS